MLIRVIAWPIWTILLMSCLAYIPIIPHLSEHPFDVPVLESDYQLALELALVFAALIEAMTTFFLRHRFLVEALHLGTISLDSSKGKIRFVLIHAVNWLLASLVAATGIVYGIVSKHPARAYGFFIIYLTLMLYHSPRLAQFKV